VAYFERPLTITIAWLLKAFATKFETMSSLYDRTFGVIFFARIAISVLALIGLFLATRSLEWFSSPKNFKPMRQDRAIALSCYICAPILIVTIVVGIASMAAVWLWTATDMQATMRVIDLAWLAVFLAWWPVSVRAIYFTTGRSARRTTIAALTLPLIWAAQQLLVIYIPISVVQWELIGWSLP